MITKSPKRRIWFGVKKECTASIYKSCGSGCGELRRTRIMGSTPIPYGTIGRQLILTGDRLIMAGNCLPGIL
ncbi:MAG: hypothetical protein PHG53_09450 [Phycisphaerae bacterium]|nr:hypothetical protein [Phycisphaerae bacterium]